MGLRAQVEIQITQADLDGIKAEMINEGASNPTPQEVINLFNCFPNILKAEIEANGASVCFVDIANWIQENGL